MGASGKATIQLYRSVTSGTRPSSLADGELFINEADALLISRDGSGNLVQTFLGSPAPVTITATTYTVVSTDGFLVFNCTAACTVTLPTPSQVWKGRQITMKTIAAFAVNSAGSSVKPLTSATSGTAILAATVGKYARLVCDGASWIIMVAN